MQAGDADFLRHLRATFRGEAEEHLQAIAAGLLQLERGGTTQQQMPVIETVFRAAHSLKGAARAVEFAAVEAECQRLEDTFAAWKRERGGPTPEGLDALHRRLNRVGQLLKQASASAASSPAPVAPAPAAVQPPATATPPPPADPLETVRVSVAVLDARLLEAEEMLAVKLAARQRVDDLRDLGRRVQDWRSAAASPERHEELLRGMERRLAGLAHAAEQERETVGKMVDDLLENAKKLLLLPFATLSAPLPKLVRDLAREEGKEAELQVEGEHIVLDKRILDTLKDPLLHLLRNCIAHGIEAPAERARRGKPVRGQLRLSVAQVAGGQVEVTVADDGAGIAPAELRAAAVRQGLLSAAEAAQFGEAESLALLFRSGVSTSPIITGLSGRGLGLPIVQENVARVGGTVTVDNRPGAGTAFRILAPAMRSTFRGVVVAVAGLRLVLPTPEVERVLRPRPADLRTVEGRETLSLDQRLLPVVALARVLELQAPPRLPSAAPSLVVLGRGEQRVAFVVDEVLDEQQLLVKPLRPPLTRVRNVAAATVLPDGQVGFILHVGDLLRSAQGAGGRLPAPPPVQAPAPGKMILVAEDSITSRTLIKGILETAGYRVATAVDGIDAYSRLRAEAFDLVVTDVEMPRLNGFDLTARIRADGRLAQLPVVLVTALETRADRERGVDVGANAYIVKSSFDQSTLVEAVRRLV